MWADSTAACIFPEPGGVPAVLTSACRGCAFRHPFPPGPPTSPVPTATSTELYPDGAADAREKPDPELLELPDPPKRERWLTVAVLLFTAIASLAMVLLLRRDAAYAFAPRDAADLGDLGAASATAFQDNRLVRGQAMLGAARAIRYQRPLAAESFRLMPVAGRPHVWAEVRVPAGGENDRWVPPREVTGRLVRFEASGPKHRGLASAVRDATGQEIPRGAWLLIEGEAPENARWAVMLVLMFAGFAIWNLVVTAKLLRKVR
jgi:hypothetical protein